MKGKGIWIGTWSFKTWTSKFKNSLQSLKMGPCRAHSGYNIDMPHIINKMLRRSWFLET